MANTLAPFGLKAVRRLDGAAPNYSVIQRQILYSDTTTIGKGDLVKDGGAGYIAKAVYNSTSHDLLGVFDGCQYYDTAQNKTIFSPMWTGVSTALSGSVLANVIVDTQLVFEVQSTGTNPIALADIGINATFVAAPVPNSITGQSTLTLDANTINTTATFPMRIVGQSARVDNDNTSASNIVEVVLNDAAIKSTTGM